MFQFGMMLFTQEAEESQCTWSIIINVSETCRADVYYCQILMGTDEVTW